jgi:RND family efflux transporter MFP subunit
MSCRHNTASDEIAEIMSVDVKHPIVDSITLYSSYPAILKSKRNVNIVCRVNGCITAKLFTNGEMVQQGTPLYTIESDIYQQKVKEAEAQLQTAEATNSYNIQEYDAMKRALESEAVSKIDVIQAESAMHQSQASIKSAQAALANASTMLSYCTIHAPYTGCLASSTLSVGDYVNGENSPVTLTTIYDNTTVTAHLAVDSDIFRAITESLATNSIDYTNIPIAFGDSIKGTYSGRLTYKAPDINPQTGTVEMHIEMNNPTGELRSGMYCTVMMPYAINSHATLINDAAIGTDQLGKYIFVVNDSNRVVYTPIHVGELYNDTMRIVTAGISPSERYITRALLKVHNGMTVAPIDVNATNTTPTH